MTDPMLHHPSRGRARLSVVPSDPSAAAGRDRAPASPELDLIDDLLGPTGLRAIPGLGRTGLVDGATELVQRLLGVDDCWLQPPGPYAESLLQGATGSPRMSTVNGTPGQPAPGRDVDSAGPVALGVVEVRFGIEEPHALVAWNRGPRVWSTRDREVLARTAEVLGEGLSDLAGVQSPAQEARRQFAELKRELLVTVNHELRTPLTVINGALEMLADTADATQRQMIGRVERNLDRLLDLAENVNLLARGLPDPLLRDEARADPALVLAGLLGDPEIPTGQLRVLPSDPVEVRADADDLRELLERVVSNAVKFSDPRDPVEVEVREHAASGEAEIVVRDTGIGIAEQEQHRLGECFFRSAEAQRLERQGAGLGLAAAISIATRWDGRLVIDSAPGSGTRVTIMLPLAARRQRADGSSL